MTLSLPTALRASGLLLVVAMLAGCSGNKAAPADEMQQAFDDLNGEIREVVTDPVRQDQVIALVKDLERRYTVLQDRMAKRQAEFVRLNANYDATQADFDAFLKKLDDESRENKEAVTSKFRELYRLLTPDERDALDKPATKAIQAATAAMDAA